MWADEFEADNIERAKKDKSLQVLSYAGSGAAVNAFNTKVAPLDDVRVRQALVMALDRKKMSQAITNGLPGRPAILTATARGSSARTTARCRRTRRRRRR